MSDELQHEGVVRRSGRYPWGSGENPEQRNTSFVGQVRDLKKKGMTETEIAKGFGMTTTQLRARYSVARNEEKKAELSEIYRLKEKNLSNVAIAERIGKGESYVRAQLNPSLKERQDIIQVTADRLREKVDQDRYVDFGLGTEHHMGVSREKLKAAVSVLQDEGYKVMPFKVQQLGTGEETRLKILAKGDVTYPELVKNQDKIGIMTDYSEDGGRTFEKIVPPKNIDAKRVSVRYGDEGGQNMDGVIELRRGVDDISLGNARYAQVRIAVGGDRYLKGMAMYADDLPDGTDLRFNTNKTKAQLQKDVDSGKAKDLKTAAMKAQKEDDEENPFGSIVRQKRYIDANGKEQLSALNIVNEEGDWSGWSAKLSSQFLSKQSPIVAKQQLGLRYAEKKEAFDEIMKLTNPAVREKLLMTFADETDSSAVHLKAAGLPRTKQHVILPINSLKDTEIYAPNYNNGERVVLIRHPHGGIFEIPELTVNNQNREARRLIKNAVDAVGINAKVASRLSGADFDGDNVIVIPNNKRQIKNKPPLKDLEGFDPQAAYPAYEGMKPMSARTKQLKMGDISNLITDMTIRGANDNEIARAVRHSMVVIDAEKHKLNWVQSARDNGISELKTKYQYKANAGATTLISRSKSPVEVNKFKPRPAELGGPIDKLTGKKVFIETGESYIRPARTVIKRGKEVVEPEEVIVKKVKIPKMAATDDAYSLSSGTIIEGVYADYANRLKAMANEARKEAVTTKRIPYSASARKVYDFEVKTLTGKLNTALKNAPLERKAQLVASAIVRAKVQANPDMDKADLKKLKGIELKRARERVGADKTQVVFTPKEWEAVQAGAVSHSMLTKLLAQADLNEVKKLATPRDSPVMTNATQARAKAMLAAGYSQSEVASQLGVATSTLNTIIIDERKG